MAIRIVRNEAGNCINFFGSSNPTYWNACLSGEVDSVDPDTINVINDVITSETGELQYEFYRIPYTEFVDADGNGFADAQAAADYITEKANVIGLSGEGIDLIGQTVCFHLDATSTSILLSNGYHYGVNSIKAIEGGGNISIISIDTNDSITHFYGLEVGNACVNGDVVSGGLNDIINTLNELFTVGAFESVVISDPFSTMVADVSGVTAGYVLSGSTAIDPVGDDVFTNSSSGNYAGLKSVATINQAGEYFTFDIRGEGQIGFGLVHTQESYDDGKFSGNANYADPSSFAVGNSAHYGFQFSHWFHPTPSGSWTNYGANTSHSQGPAWYNSNVHFEGRDEWLAGNPIKMKVGIDENGFISIASLADDGITWKVHARTSYPVADGAEFHLGIKIADNSARVYTEPKVHLLEPAAPTMYFRYIESPDDNFHYPLFATEEEANYYDLQNGGTGTSSTNVYPDEPTFSTWYEPTNGYIHSGTTAPTGGTFEGNAINWTEITSQVNADLAPSAFSDTTITVDELSAVNVQLHPVDAPYTTTIVDNDNSGLSLDANGVHLQGSAPEVTGDYSTNPTDTYTIDIVRTNSYGSASGTLTVIVTNLTAPVTAISGFTHVSGSTAMIDSDTMDDGSVVNVNGTVADGERFVIEKAYVEANILPNLTAADDMYIIGLANQPEDFSTLELSDFDTAIVWEYESASSHTFKFYRDGVVQQNIVINSLTQAFYDYAIEVNGTSAWLIACNVDNIMNEASPADGGTFSNTYEATSIEDSAPVTIHMAALNTSGDISAADISTITTPAPSATNLTPWTKALDFSGGAEHLKQVTQSTGSNALRMNGLSQLAAANSDSSKTSSDTYSRPWATAIVFQTPNNTSNQHIWNSGEGTSTGSDNIYLRMSGSNGELYFGWGREGVGYNEYHIGNFGGSYNQSTGQWWGIYISHDGTRLNASDATAANLTSAFDIRLMGTNDVTPVFDTLYDVGSTSSNWVSTGVRMDRAITGDFTIGGRGANRSFHGKVASMVVTTLVKGATKPTDAEIKLMLTDPMKWEDDYKDGQSARYASSGSNFIYGPSNSNSKYATQIWLMGDGAQDSYANGIRNHVDPTDQNYTKLQLNSMVSNDIQNVTISGLS